MATRTRVNQAPSAPIDLSMMNTMATAPAASHATVPGTSQDARAHYPRRVSDSSYYAPSSPSQPLPDLPSTLTTRPRVDPLVQAVGLRCGQEGARTLSPSTTLPSASPLDARLCAMPAIAEISADLTNLVGDTPTAANSRIHSLPGSTATTPGPSTPASFPSST